MFRLEGDDGLSFYQRPWFLTSRNFLGRRFQPAAFQPHGEAYLPL